MSGNVKRDPTGNTYRVDVSGNLKRDPTGSKVGTRYGNFCPDTGNCDFDGTVSGPLRNILVRWCQLIDSEFSCAYVL